MSTVTCAPEVFSVPHQGRYLLYFPFSRTVVEGNAALANLVYEVQQGSASARQRLCTILGDRCGVLLDDHRQSCALRSPPEPGPFQTISLSVFLTRDCTLRCRYCYASAGEDRTSMPWDMVTGIIDLLFDNATAVGSQGVTVNFHGGDVGVVWPLFVRTRDYLRRKESDLGIRVVTTVGTNGVLDNAQLSWLTENIDSATLSVDGPPALHDSARVFPDGRPSSALVLRTIEHLDRVGFRYGIRSTITAESVCRMDEIAHYLSAKSAARRLQMEPLWPRGRASGGGVRPPSARDFIDNFRKARKVALAHGRMLSYSGARLGTLTNVFCKACGDSCVVTPDGDLTSCYEVADPTSPLADTFCFGRYDARTRGFVVDESRRKRLFRLSVLDKPGCANCFCKWHCAGDCPAKSLPAAEMPDQPDRCLINRELTKDQLLAALGNEGSGRGWARLETPAGT